LALDQSAQELDLQVLFLPQQLGVVGAMALTEARLLGMVGVTEVTGCPVLVEVLVVTLGLVGRVLLGMEMVLRVVGAEAEERHAFQIPFPVAVLTRGQVQEAGLGYVDKEAMVLAALYLVLLQGVAEEAAGEVRAVVRPAAFPPPVVERMEEEEVFT
jgi:hypothetical protein